MRTFTRPLGAFLLAASLAFPVLAASPAVAQTDTTQPMSWGAPSKGGPACGGADCSQVPQPAGPPGAVSVDGENNFNLAVMGDGTVMAWGTGTSGQLGDGTAKSSAAPVQVQGLANVTQTAGGNSDAAALEGNGSVWTWGNNADGQLGIGSTNHSTVPVQVGLPGPACAVNAGGDHDYALLCDGTVWAWGSGLDGQLGDGSTANQLTPVQVPGLPGVTAITSGNLFGLAQTSLGTVYGWGSGRFGQLCDGSTRNVRTPVLIPSLAGAAEVSAGGNIPRDGHTLALTAAGTVEACGDNADGQLGDGTPGGFSTSPQPVSGLSGVTSVSAGGAHSMALDAAGEVWAWGANEQGQVGDGSTADSDVPVPVLSGVTAISAGSMHSLALAVGASGAVRELPDPVWLPQSPLSIAERTGLPFGRVRRALVAALSGGSKTSRWNGE